jgi:putative membrane protein
MAITKRLIGFAVVALFLMLGTVTVFGVLANRTWAQVNGMTVGDTDFLREAAQYNHAEIEGSRLALAKSSNPRVKAYAQQMLDEHTAALSELQALAKVKSVELPTEPSVLQRAQLRLLAAIDDPSFDKRFANQIGVNAHEDTVRLYERNLSQVQDLDVLAYCAKTLPVLQGHLATARQLKVATDSVA